jgi:predicted phosphodiesterase
MQGRASFERRSRAREGIDLMKRMFMGMVAFLAITSSLTLDAQFHSPTSKGLPQSGLQGSPADSGDPLIGSPYLQLGDLRRGNSAQIDLVWHAAPDASAWSVEYKEQSEASWKKARDARFRLVDIQGVPAHRIYNATILRLKAGEPFDYRLLRNGKAVFTGQATAKNSDKQDYRFAVFGDCGANTASQRKVAYQTYLAKPNFVVIPGDIVYGSGRISEYRTNFFSVYEAAEASPNSGAPLLNATTMIAAPGNHDTEENRDPEVPDLLAYFLYWSQPLNGPALKPGGRNSPAPPGTKFESSFEKGAGHNFPTMENFSFDWGNAHWTVLDSNQYVDWNDQVLRKWVADDLHKAKEKQWRFVAFHHPGFSSSKMHFEDQQMRALSDIFEKEHADIVFAGHVHNYQRSLPLTFQIAEWAKPGKVQWKDLHDKPIDGVFSLDQEFDGVTKTHPRGTIYIVTGAGGQALYDPEQGGMPETWQKFTARFISNVHSFTLVDIHGGDLNLKQVSEDGEVLDQIKITK